MKLEFTIPGFARAQGRTKAVAMLPKGGKALLKGAQDILDFYGTQPIPAEQQEVLRKALGLSARAHVYDQAVDRDWKNTIRWHLIRHRQTPLWDGAVILEARFVSLIPKSYPRWMRDAVESGQELPRIVKPDTEQLVKPIKDACQGLIWRDDALVWKETVVKVYGKVPRVDVALELFEVFAGKRRSGDARQVSKLRTARRSPALPLDRAESSLSPGTDP